MESVTILTEEEAEIFRLHQEKIIDGYKQRWGDNWEEMLKEELLKDMRESMNKPSHLTLYTKDEKLNKGLIDALIEGVAQTEQAIKAIKEAFHNPVTFERMRKTDPKE